MTPKQFVDLYNKVSGVEFEAKLKNDLVVLERTGQLQKPGGIPYINCNFLRYKKNKQYQQRIYQFFKKSKIQGVNHTGLAAVGNVTSHPFTGFTTGYFVYSLCGQGCPDMLLAMNQFITYYENYKFFKRKRRLPDAAETANIKKLVKKKLGLDCVGFVGNFLKCNYKACSTIRPTYMDTGNFKKFGIPLNDVSEVCAKAIVIFIKKKGSHIAIIDRILPQHRPNVLNVQLCEARVFLRCRKAKIRKKYPTRRSRTRRSRTRRPAVFKMGGDDVLMYNLDKSKLRSGPRTGSSTCACGIKWLKKHPL